MIPNLSEFYNAKEHVTKRLGARTYCPKLDSCVYTTELPLVDVPMTRPLYWWGTISAQGQRLAETEVPIISSELMHQSGERRLLIASSHNSQLIPICLLHTNNLAETVLPYVFKMAFPASLVCPEKVKYRH